jgi:triosephosphate isomerase (TIM)
MRRPLVIANWKMHGDVEANRGLVVSFLNLRKDRGEGGAESVVCPPFPYLLQVKELLASSDVALGAQDCSHSDAGAYTGEVAAAMLADCGCSWVIVGHSERRQYHQESDALIAAKIVAAQRAGLRAVLCVGETLEQREAGEAEAVVREQLLGGLADQGDLREVVVAYEPVWAIGTGLTATPDVAQEMHAHVRAVLRDLDGRNADAVQLLYGGSVKADNAAALFAEADIDGALVGGASLDAEAFATVVAAA